MTEGMDDIQRLNEKIARWCSFTWPKGGHCDVARVPYDAAFQGKLPNFNESLDALEQWVFPELIKRFGALKVRYLLSDCIDDAITDIKYGVPVASCLCLAIEKLIDVEAGK